MFQKILVPLDFSEYTDEIMNVAAQIAQKFGSTIHLLHVIPNMDYFTPYESFLSAGSLINIQREIEREVGKDMEAVAKKIKDITVTKAIHTGIAVLEIVDYVRAEKIDLVVMGTHGRGGLEHILIGSVAEKVVRKSPCPVLTIRPAAKQL
ncbi:MAG TPA: universal stress protein [Syntrophorhabdales bacterium]|nr:universal stress protein [Syntrophorhabdales bacterium]